MLSLYEITIVLILAMGAGWWWHIHGQRDYALKCIKAHCLKLHLTLLDGYVALKKITFNKDNNGKWRLARVYSFEFTVTGEQRYTGYITLFGYYIGKIELPPYVNNEQDTNTTDTILDHKPHTPILSLDDYRRRKHNHD